MADENLWPDGEHDVCIVSMSNLDTKDKDKKFINWKKSKLFNIDKAEVMEKKPTKPKMMMSNRAVRISNTEIEKMQRPTIRHQILPYLLEAC